MEGKKSGLWQAIMNRRMLICIFNGFTSGLPLYFLAQLIPAWLRSEHVDLKTIGFFSLVLLPFSFKYLWAPFIDSYVPPFLGRRRGWMIVAQVALLAFMSSLSLLNPQADISIILYVGLAIGFFSATQDIVLDAYRRELLSDNELGLGNSFYANAYRVAGFIPGGLGLILSDYMPWPMVFIVISLFMFVGVIHTFMIKEVNTKVDPPKTLKEAVSDPFKEFFLRDGLKSGILILLFIFFYKFGDTVATALITPFYIDVGFTKTVIGTVAKVVGLWSMLIGGFLGGLLMFRLGINKALWIFGIVQMLSILGFAVLNEIGPNIMALSVVVGFEYLGVGLGSAALMAFIAKSTNKKFTGTQLALLTSLFAIPKSFSGILAGVLVEGVKVGEGAFFSFFGQIDGIGYTNFFYICTLLAIPGMLLLFWVAPWGKNSD
ncbi:MAG: AmpG family muropeptide MFS transporter [Bacteriovoracaceae bacterium]|nr:AmpG family muropeptide MFS transporter [Bacteriovoracaceae bacterium]